MRKYILTLLLILSALVLIGCSTTKNVPKVEVVSHTIHDTLYTIQEKYDSIYIYKSRDVDYIKGVPKPSTLNPPLGRNGRLPEQEPDTVLIREVATEYRYKMLRDTIYKVQTDSIPVIKEIEIVKAEPYIPWWSKALSCIGAIVLGIVLIKFSINHKLL